MARQLPLTIINYFVAPPPEVMEHGLVLVPKNQTLNDKFAEFYITPSHVQQLIKEEDTRLEEAIEKQGLVFAETTLERTRSDNLFWMCEFPANIDGARLLSSKAKEVTWVIDHSGPHISNRGEYLHSIIQKRGYLRYPGNLKRILEGNDLLTGVEIFEEDQNLERNRPLNFLVWNCRDAASPGFRRNFKQLMTRCSPDVLAITETQISGKRARSICASLNFDRCFVADPGAFGGGLWLMWNTKDQFICNIFALSQQKIHVTMSTVRDLL